MPLSNEDFEDLLLANPGATTQDPDIQGGPSPEEIKSMREQLSNMEKERKGLIKNVQEERRKRQELKGRLDEVTNTVNSIIQNRELQPKDLEPKDGGLKGIPVEFTEDGDGYIPFENFNSITSKYEEEINALKEQLAATRNESRSAQEYNQTVSALVGEKPEFAEAHRRYQAARKWLNDVVTDWAYNNGINRSLTSGEALTHVIDEDVIRDFKNEFPDLDPVLVTTAEDSPWHFKTMLQKTSEALSSIQPAPQGSRFQRVINKPSTLGRSANAKGGEISLTEKVASLSATDIMALSDEQIAALSNYLKDDEQKDGINW